MFFIRAAVADGPLSVGLVFIDYDIPAVTKNTEGFRFLKVLPDKEAHAQ